MVLKDAELDELWRAAGSFRGRQREHLEAAIENEQTFFSTVIERLVREYRDLKADYEHQAQKYEQLQSDYQKHVQKIFDLKRENDRLNKEAARLQQLMQRR